MNFKKLAEKAFIKRLITQLYPEGIVSVVADSFDFWRVITEIAPELKDEILNRQPNALGLCKTVFRPDSGDPVKILTGYMKGTHPDNNDGEVYQGTTGFWFKAEDWEHNHYLDYSIKSGAKPLSEVEVKGAVECLWEIFGGTETDKGYKMLNDKVGLIYGDSITRDRAIAILDRL